MPKEMGGMGFRDLRLFNLVLLVKQGWRLQTNSTSLVAWVFKLSSLLLHRGRFRSPPFLCLAKHNGGSRGGAKGHEVANRLRGRCESLV